jgi:hypothetical protein
LLEIRRTFDGTDQIRYEIDPALVGRFHLRPLVSDVLLLADEAVEAGPGPADEHHKQDEQSNEPGFLDHKMRGKATSV